MNASLARTGAGNVQWAAGIQRIAPDFFTDQAEQKQTPKVLWIGCADSRVPESVITGSIPGDIFVHRNIANQFRPDDANALAILDYAVNNLKVEHIVVVGHTLCGGVEASYKAANPCTPKLEPANLVASESHWLRTSDDSPVMLWLSRLTELVKKLGLGQQPPEVALPLITEANVREQVANIAATDIVREALMDCDKSLVAVHGWVYDLEDGLLKPLSSVPQSVEEGDDPGEV